MIKFLPLLLILMVIDLFAQVGELEIFPQSLNFIPLKANLYEAKMGLTYIPENNDMKLDIGDNIDILSYQLSDVEKLSLGIEFFAYALSRSYMQSRLQIDAIDGLFGGNISYSRIINEKILSGRLRIIHNSAHLVDGHWDYHNDQWIDNYKPVPYSRDFAELDIAYQYDLGFAIIRNYSAFDYAFLIRPSDVKRFNFSAGIEMGLKELSGSLLGKPFNPFVAYDFLFSGSDKYVGSNNSIIGIKFGGWNERGLSIFISYYNGLDVFHAYYKRKVERFGLGFSVDLL